MPISDDILPPHSGRAERALVAGVVGGFQFDVLVRHIYSPATAPAQVMPWLAWAFSADDWDDAWTEVQKRAAIAGSAAWHRSKGTRASVLAVLAQEGFADALLIEDRDLPRLGRGWVLGRGWRLGPSDPHWADYWIVADGPLYRAEAERLARRLAETAPARCRLRSIRADGTDRFVLGRGWTLGDAVTLGSIYHFQGDNHG